MPNSSNLNNTFNSLESTLAPYFLQKAPQLPADLRKLLAQLTPWYALISTAINVMALLVLTGIGTFFTPFYFMMGARGGAMTFYNLLPLLFLIPITILEAMSIGGLFAQRMQGWKYLFYASVIGVVSSIVDLSIGGVIWSIISFYFLFQIRSEFTH